MYPICQCKAEGFETWAPHVCSLKAGSLGFKVRAWAS